MTVAAAHGLVAAAALRWLHLMAFEQIPIEEHLLMGRQVGSDVNPFVAYATDSAATLAAAAGSRSVAAEDSVDDKVAKLSLVSEVDVDSGGFAVGGGNLH